MRVDISLSMRTSTKYNFWIRSTAYPYRQENFEDTHDLRWHRRRRVEIADRRIVQGQRRLAIPLRLPIRTHNAID